MGSRHFVSGLAALGALGLLVGAPAALAEAACSTGTPAVATPLDQEVVREINRVRTRPADYAQSLWIFRSYIHDGVVEAPGEAAEGATPEFMAALDDAIVTLEHQPPLPPLRLDSRLTQSAAAFAADQGPKGRMGHVGSDGSTILKRVQGQCFYAGTAAEVLAYGRTSAKAAVRDLVIDWGSRAAAHRSDLLDPALQSIGVADAPHARMGHVIVVDMAGQELKR